jgi:hypothetical protein
VSLVFIMYHFIYNPRVKSIKMLIFFENPSIHIYLFFYFLIFLFLIFEILIFYIFLFFFIFFYFYFFVRCHPSVLSHHALGTVECDESYCNEKGGHIWSSGCGEFFYHESYCDERVVMTIYGFQISGGWGYALIWNMGGVYPYMGTP